MPSFRVRPLIVQGPYILTAHPGVTEARPRKGACRNRSQQSQNLENTRPQPDGVGPCTKCGDVATIHEDNRFLLNPFAHANDNESDSEKSWIHLGR